MSQHTTGYMAYIRAVVRGRGRHLACLILLYISASLCIVLQVSVSGILKWFILQTKPALCAGIECRMKAGLFMMSVQVLSHNRSEGINYNRQYKLGWLFCVPGLREAQSLWGNRSVEAIVLTPLHMNLHDDDRGGFRQHWVPYTRDWWFS
jgi:hypothetical protein